MLRFAPTRQAARAIAFTSQATQTAVPAAATQALTARWMSAAAPGPKVSKGLLDFKIVQWIYARLE